MKYKITVAHITSIHDNSKYWQVFKDDMQIKIFLEMSDEFVNTQIDAKNQNIAIPKFPMRIEFFSKKFHGLKPCFI